MQLLNLSILTNLISSTCTFLLDDSSRRPMECELSKSVSSSFCSSQVLNLSQYGETHSPLSFVIISLKLHVEPFAFGALLNSNKKILVRMKNRLLIDRYDPISQFCAPFVTLDVVNVGIQRVVAAWNAHST